MIDIHVLNGRLTGYHPEQLVEINGVEPILLPKDGGRSDGSSIDGSSQAHQSGLDDSTEDDGQLRELDQNESLLSGVSSPNNRSVKIILGERVVVRHHGSFLCSPLNLLL